MIKKILWGVLALLVLGAIGFFGFAPGYVEGTMNIVEKGPLPTVTAETKKLHDTLQIADMHADTLMWQRSLLSRASRGQIDLPRCSKAMSRSRSSPR